VITDATDADAGELVTLQRAAFLRDAQLYGDPFLPSLVQGVDDLRGEIDATNTVFLKAVFGQRIVGSVRAVVTGRVAHIGRLLTAPDLEGQGIGGRLMDAVEAALDSRVDTLELSTGGRSTSNIAMYERRGYRIVERRQETEALEIVTMRRGRHSDAEIAARQLASLTGVDHHDVALVLGSGWSGSVDALGATVAELSTSQLEGFRPSVVEGHTGRVRSMVVAGRPVLALLGRTHLYEHRDPVAVAHPVRVAAASGCRVVVLTNACGAINERFRPGQLVVITDHINMTGTSPLVGPQFVDLSDLYSGRLRTVVHGVEPDIEEGVYVGYWGPNYETPAEIRAYRALGGDLVGMSTVLEAIAARAAGMEVVGLSLVTNMAAGLAGPLSHAEVLEVGRAGEARAGDVLRAVTTRVAAQLS
jgi:purine-nucleoside phosphorylase